MEENNALALIFARNAFYRRQFYLALSAFGLSLLVIFSLMGVLVFLKRNPTHPLYFATDKVGRLIEVVPVSQPNMSRDEVITWSIEAVQNAYSYDYFNYHSQLQNAQKYFTEYGWGKYMQALKASNNINALTERKMVVIAQVVDKPVISREGILSGSYAWRMTMPLLVTYMLPPYDDKSRFSNALQVSVIVQRQPILQSYRGLGVVQLIATMAASGPAQPQEISNTPTE